MKKTRKRMLNAGYSTVVVSLFAFGVSVMGAAALSLSAGMDKHAQKSNENAQASSLAESGIHTLYDQIRQEMVADLNYPFVLGEQEATVNNGHAMRTIGSYSAKVLDVKEVQTDIEMGDKKVRRFTYTFYLEGLGKTNNGMVTTMRSRFDAVLERDLVKKGTGNILPTEADQFHFPIGAIVSNSTVDIRTKAKVRTLAPNGLDAHIIANEGIIWQTALLAATAKDAFTAPDIMDVQGQYLVPAGGFYDTTVSPAGIGNPLGIKNYTNPPAPPAGAFPGGPPNTVLPMPEPVQFATEAEVDEWTAKWLAAATGLGSTTYPGGNAPAVIQAPAIVDGNMMINGTTKLMPKGTNPKYNVVYVRRNVVNNGTLQNLGVNLIIEGEYTDNTNATYEVTSVGSFFATQQLALMRSSMISLSKAKQSIRFTTNKSSTIGLVYAAKGGILVTGKDITQSGLLLAGGNGSGGGIQIAPVLSRGYTISYLPEAATGGELEVDPDSEIDIQWETAGVSRLFAPGPLYDWQRRK